MKYICLGYMNQDVWATLTESERNTFMDECFTYDKELMANGNMVGGEGLQEARNAATLTWSSGKVSVTDGPFVESKEQIGGLMMLEATDMNHAIRLLSKHPSLRLGRGASSWEIRPAVDLTGFMEESERRKS